MTRPSRRSVATALALAAAVLTGSAFLVYGARRDPAIPWLAARSPAHWIIYPTAPRGLAHPAVELRAVFQRSLRLPRRPRSARLEVRCFRSCRVSLNGTLLPLAAGATWKEAAHAEPLPWLREGDNALAVTVGNGSGPPALWLTLATDAGHLVSDESWGATLVGATPLRARRATLPLSEWSSPGLPRPDRELANPAPGRAVREHWLLLVGFALLAFLVISGARLWSARQPPSRRPRPAAWAGAFVVLAAALSALLFLNNRGLDLHWGFDADGHLEYVRTVLERHRTPLADEGWETFQPPLYYATAAGLLALTGHAHVDAAVAPWLRGLGWCALLVQSLSLFASLRLLFPRRPWPLLGGLCVGLFLPAELYLSQYVTNEVWAAALSSLAIALTLALLRRLRRTAPEDVPMRPFVILGLVLGLALLTKVSSLLTLVAVVAALAGRLTTSSGMPAARGAGRLAARGARRRLLLRPLGFLLLTTAAVCGWHFARVIARFGDPLVGNWNAVIGYAWWQDPGYHTWGDLVRFGRALTAPLYSAFHSVPDGLYSTLWGDGLLGGSGLLLHRPPWNYGLMAAGYALAVLPAAALALGAVLVVSRLIRRPRAEDLLLAGLAAGTGWALVYMCLRVPSYAQAKGFYGLLALVPICALAGRGLECLAGEPRGRREAPATPRHRWTRRPALRIRSAVIAILLGVWACDAFATYWMRTADRGGAAGAALALDPDGLLARADAAAAPQERAAVLRQLVARDPDHPFAWLLLGDTLAREGDLRGAESAWREQLRVDPFSAAAHLRLGRTLELEGRPAEAQAHLALAARLGRAQ